jgi:hypothetical protein
MNRLKSAIQGALWLIRAPGLRLSFERLEGEVKRLESAVNELSSKVWSNTLEEHRLRNLEKWRAVRDLRAFERRVYSQNGEDGIIQEIFWRIGVESKYFVEFGVETGAECNCARLVLEEGWKGLFIEANPSHFEKLAERYKSYHQIRCAREFITSANIEALLAQNGVPTNLDILSIDIDGNDYWVWTAIKNWSPRLVIVEYNPTIAPTEKWVMAERLDHRWDFTDYFGASLAALAELGRKKGYTLVATDSRGINAFFVRDDLVADRFLDPAVIYHYSPLNHSQRAHPLPIRNGPSVAA